jgi:hypothetical protein
MSDAAAAWVRQENLVHVRHLAYQSRRRDWSQSADVILICNLVDDEIAAGGTDL